MYSEQCSPFTTLRPSICCATPLYLPTYTDKSICILIRVYVWPLCIHIYQRLDPFFRACGTHLTRSALSGRGCRKCFEHPSHPDDDDANQRPTSVSINPNEEEEKTHKIQSHTAPMQPNHIRLGSKPNGIEFVVLVPNWSHRVPCDLRRQCRRRRRWWQ